MSLRALPACILAACCLIAATGSVATRVWTQEADRRILRGSISTEPEEEFVQDTVHYGDGTVGIHFRRAASRLQSRPGGHHVANLRALRGRLLGGRIPVRFPRIDAVRFVRRHGRILEERLPEEQNPQQQGNEAQGQAASSQGTTEGSSGNEGNGSSGQQQGGQSETSGGASQSQGGDSSSDGQAGPTECNEELRRKLHDHLHNVVVIININYGWVARNTADFWRKLYGPIFDNIVIVSTEANPEMNIEWRGPWPWRNDWRKQYFCLPKIMARYPDADGFLWTNDDVIVNYWKFLNADTTKIWLPNDPNNPEFRHFPFNDTIEIEHPEENARPEYRRMAKMAYLLLDDDYKVQYDRSSEPHVGHFQKRICDLFYLPKRHVEAFAFDIVPAFREARVSSEVAIPTMFYALEHPQTWDHVLDDMVYRWDHWSGSEEVRKAYDPSRYWTPEISALHPWKISKPIMRAKLIQSLSQGDTCVCRDFPDLCHMDTQSS